MIQVSDEERSTTVAARPVFSVNDESVSNSRTVLHWYDFWCPFCYVAESRNEILERQGSKVVQLPFEVHPDLPGGGVDAGRRSSIYALPEQEPAKAGRILHWPVRVPNTRLALAAAEWVRRELTFRN